MLLRSSSTPILDSWVHHSRDSSSSSPESTHLQLGRTKSGRDNHPTPTRSVNLPAGFKVLPAGSKPSGPTHKRTAVRDNGQQEEEGGDVSGSLERLLSSSGLGEVDVVVNELKTAVGGGGGGGGGGSGGGRGTDGDQDWSDSGSYSMDAYYQKMVDANPGNGLLLGNYANFLKEVRGDMIKAEEYCGRAILANPKDADALSLYGDLIWQTEKDAQRAEPYFEQAIHANPDDSFVMASYARFLWDVEDDEDDEDGEVEGGGGGGQYYDQSHMRPPKFLQGVNVIV